MMVILAPGQLPRNATECNGSPQEKGVAARVNGATAGRNFVATETQRREDGEEHDRNGDTLQLEADAHGDLHGLQLAGGIIRVL